MRYKNLSKEQLIISFDRLTRFKPTKEKYFRVFSDIILSNLIEPVYKKQDLANTSAKEITQMAEEIINESLKDLYLYVSISIKNEGKINSIIKEYENAVFINDDNTQEYLKNNIDYNAFINLIDESCPINLRWLKILSNSLIRTENFYPSTQLFLQSYEGEKVNIDNKEFPTIGHKKFLSVLRQENGLKYPIEKVILVEGITEEILLPAFSKFIGYDFCKEGIQILPAGGKNQVVKMYYELIEELRLPIFILLDKDAEENIAQINPKLRNIDKIHLVSCGEFEDLLPKSLIIKTVNNELSNFASISEKDLDNDLSEVENLENIFKTKGLHEFKKTEFAKLVRDNISEYSDISEEIKCIIKELQLLNM